MCRGTAVFRQSVIGDNVGTMKVLLMVVCVVLSVLSARAENYAQQLKQKGAAESPKEVEKFIAESRDENQNDPAYYVASANYWWGLAKEPYMSTKPPTGDDLVIADQKTGEAVGSFSTTGKANPEVPQKAIDLLTEGYKRFPQRLDIGMGLAYMLRDENRQAECFKVLESVLTNSAKYRSELRWKDGGALPKPPEVYIPELMNGYTAGFYELETPEGNELSRRLCESVIAAYPDHPYAYNILAALSMAKKDDKSAVGYLQTGLSKAPHDTLMMLNLANAYRRLGDNAQALETYRLILTKSPPEDIKGECEEWIKDLAEK